LITIVFRGDAGHFSLAVAAFGGGGLLGAAVLLGIAPGDPRWLSSGFAVAYGCVVTLVGLDRWFWAIPLLLVIAGASMAISNTAANSLLQATARPQLLGQTVSLYMLAMRGGMSVGALLTGITVSRWGVQRALVVNGLVAVAAQATLARAWTRFALPGATTE
jgi:predicted MFS family arabinose efflux permease